MFCTFLALVLRKVVVFFLRLLESIVPRRHLNRKHRRCAGQQELGF